MSKASENGEIAEKEYAEKLGLKEKEERYYKQKTKELGLKAMERFVKYHPEPSEYMRRGISYAHQGLETIAAAMSSGEPWAAVSGLNPSGPLHFGHKTVFEELLWIQKQGAEIFIPLTNDESYLVGKSQSLGDSREIAYKHVIPEIIAMGFEPKKTHMFVDSDFKDIYNLAMDLSRKLTLNKAMKVFGFNSVADNPGTLFYRSAVQLAHILLPQLYEFGGPKPTVIPVGIDQHPYILLARDVAEKKDMIPPSELSIRFMWGLNGKGKMSASRSSSAVFLRDTPEVAEAKILDSYTGGSVLSDFQREHGGIPEICPVYSLQNHHFGNGEELYRDCTQGRILCEQCKRNAVGYVTEFIGKYTQQVEEARSVVGGFLLDTPLKSILE